MTTSVPTAAALATSPTIAIAAANAPRTTPRRSTANGCRVNWVTAEW